MDKYNDISKQGVLGPGYATGRKNNRALKYRLWRRTQEVKNAIKGYLSYEAKNIIDLGTADGEMIFELSKSFPKTKFTGIEYNRELVQIANETKMRNVNIIEGDVNEISQLDNQKYDVVIATAIIEHVDNPELFMQNVFNLLNKHGILILTAPDPFWEKIATFVGHLHDEQHNEVPNLKRLKELSEKTSLKVELLKKFMISPIGLIYEEKIEKLFRSFGLSFMMANQLLIARKVS